MVASGTRIICMIYCCTSFLGWICTIHADPAQPLTTASDGVDDSCPRCECFQVYFNTSRQRERFVVHLSPPPHFSNFSVDSEQTVSKTVSRQ